MRIAVPNKGSLSETAIAMLAELPLRGRLQADLAVLELDEAHALHFGRAVAPSHALLLNVARDQLDRFAEIDHTARLLTTLASKSTDGVVLNVDDSFVSRIAPTLEPGTSVRWFGLDASVADRLPELQEQVRALRAEMADQFRLMADESLRRQGADLERAHAERLGALLTPFREQVARFQDEVQAGQRAGEAAQAALRTHIEGLHQRSEQIGRDAVALTRAGLWWEALAASFAYGAAELRVLVSARPRGAAVSEPAAAAP